MSYLRLFCQFWATVSAIAGVMLYGGYWLARTDCAAQAEAMGLKGKLVFGSCTVSRDGALWIPLANLRITIDGKVTQ